MTYYINYHTGAGDRTFTGTLADAKVAADEGAAYTQQDITISDAETGAEISRRRWYGVAFDDSVDDSTDIISYGDYGYYGDWYDCDY